MGSEMCIRDSKYTPQLGETDEIDSEDDEYIDLEKVSSEAGEIEASSVARGVFGNDLSKKKSSLGPDALQMPNFGNMIGNSRPQDTMNDPYDASWIRNWGKRNQMETKEKRLADVIAGMETIKDPIPKTLQPHMTYDTQRMLEKMDSKLGIKRLMTEGTNNYEQIIEEHFDLDFDMENDDE